MNSCVFLCSYSLLDSSYSLLYKSVDSCYTKGAIFICAAADRIINIDSVRSTALVTVIKEMRQGQRPTVHFI